MRSLFNCAMANKIMIFIQGKNWMNECDVNNLFKINQSDSDSEGDCGVYEWDKCIKLPDSVSQVAPSCRWSIDSIHQSMFVEHL